MTEFVRATQRDVIRFLTPLTAPSDVEDLTQETFLRALRGLPEYAGRSSARTWLFAIARRVAADHVRGATRRPRVAAVADWQAIAEAAGAAGTGTIRSRVARAREDLGAALGARAARSA